ncbi:MAG: hypothetical protein K6C98_09770 [Treponema sp.]|nr:hypothetical protein [Treponema sp.]
MNSTEFLRKFTEFSTNFNNILLYIIFILGEFLHPLAFRHCADAPTSSLRCGGRLRRGSTLAPAAPLNEISHIPKNQYSIFEKLILSEFSSSSRNYRSFYEKNVINTCVYNTPLKYFNSFTTAPYLLSSQNQSFILPSSIKIAYIAVNARQLLAIHHL